MTRCKCIEQLNEVLASQNARIATAFQVTESLDVRMKILVATERIDQNTRKALPVVAASHCPFCGVKLGGGA